MIYPHLIGFFKRSVIALKPNEIFRYHTESRSDKFVLRGITMWVWKQTFLLQLFFAQYNHIKYEHVIPTGVTSFHIRTEQLSSTAMKHVC